MNANIFGPTWAVILTSLIFVLAHVEVSYFKGADLIVFLVILVFLALAWGSLMQQSDSIWGSVIFHAGTDLVIVGGFLAAFHARAET